LSQALHTLRIAAPSPPDEGAVRLAQVMRAAMRAQRSRDMLQRESLLRAGAASSEAPGRSAAVCSASARGPIMGGGSGGARPACPAERASRRSRQFRRVAGDCGGASVSRRAGVPAEPPSTAKTASTKERAGVFPDRKAGSLPTLSHPLGAGGRTEVVEGLGRSAPAPGSPPTEATGLVEGAARAVPLNGEVRAETPNVRGGGPWPNFGRQVRDHLRDSRHGASNGSADRPRAGNRPLSGPGADARSARRGPCTCGGSRIARKGHPRPGRRRHGRRALRWG